MSRRTMYFEVVPNSTPYEEYFYAAHFDAWQHGFNSDFDGYASLSIQEEDDPSYFMAIPRRRIAVELEVW